jgi:hypothetical protein
MTARSAVTLARITGKGIPRHRVMPQSRRNGRAPHSVRAAGQNPGFRTARTACRTLPALTERLRHRNRLKVLIVICFMLNLPSLCLKAAGAFEARGGQFIGFSRFSAFEHSNPSTAKETVLTSPVIEAQIQWNELVASWNADCPAGTYLKVEARAIYPPHTTGYYVLGWWATDPPRHPRESVPNQKDADGTVATDTLVLGRPASRLQVRVTLGGDHHEHPKLKFLGISLVDTGGVVQSLPANQATWDRLIPVPKRTQLIYPNAKVICSPTVVSMILAYWSQRLGRPELDCDVPAVAAGVYDAKWPGTGNWPFNTAFAGSFPGLRAYVTRLSDISEIEAWIQKGVPVGVSLCYDRLRAVGPGPNGHLMVCAGFDAHGDPILNDPAERQEIRSVYPRNRLAHAWAYSRNTVYLIYPTNWEVPKDRFGHWNSWTARQRIRFDRN